MSWVWSRHFHVCCAEGAGLYQASSAPPALTLSFCVPRGRLRLLLLVTHMAPLQLAGWNCCFYNTVLYSF